MCCQKMECVLRVCSRNWENFQLHGFANTLIIILIPEEEQLPGFEDTFCTMELNSSLYFSLVWHFKIVYVCITTLCPSPQQEKRMVDSGTFRKISCDKQMIKSSYISQFIGSIWKVAKIGDSTFAIFICPSVATWEPINVHYKILCR
jgi:hypothetical protein